MTLRPHGSTRTITTAHRQLPSYQNAPPDVQMTARALWMAVDADARLPIDLPALARALYPLDDPSDARDRIETHLLTLEEAGFLQTFALGASEWLELTHPLPDAPPKPPDDSRGFSAENSPAMGGARARERAAERARERVRAERAARDREFADARAREAQPAPLPPRRPASLDAPPLGCPDHPRGSFPNCGPCGTARRQYDLFIDTRRYEDKLADWEFWHGNDDDEPF